MEKKRKKKLKLVVGFPCLEAVVFKMVYCNMEYAGPGMNLYSVPLSFFRAHLWAEKNREAYTGSSHPTILMNAFWVCTQKAEWTKDPPKKCEATL